MEDFNTFDDVQTDVVDQSETEATEASEVTEEVTTETVSEPAKPIQSAEENARFAAARREAESQAKALKAQNDRLMQALGQYGYQGDPDTIADALFAQSQGISVEEATAQRRAAEAENALQIENETLRNTLLDFVGKEELTKLKSTFPEDAKIQALKSVGELGMDFLKLATATGGDSILAYEAFKAKTARETKPIPQDIGAVNSSSSKEKDFYTSAEVDRLTDTDMENPRIREIVRKSMFKWK